MKFQPFKLAASVLVFFALSALGHAQSSIGNQVGYLNAVGQGDGSTYRANIIGTNANFANFGEAFRPVSLTGGTYTGDYLLTITVNVDANDWSGLSPTISGLFKGISIDGNWTVFSDGLHVFDTTFSQSAISTAQNSVEFSYTAFDLYEKQSIDFQASYTVTAIPEPSTYALIFGACTLGLVAWRRFRK